ncbi:hypothetical protein G7Z17_g4098 [Cylindrodendrum hubeiense]|uniref:alpha-galactosidase n=1 Tax=Cylindrodendrum hubeiense TaxID=595255 RepID=A0A9P5HBC0_9HYPO|nr:hypothetical protein G7Z17_g4098 [Cylindrodendrum hubeiense]
MENPSAITFNNGITSVTIRLDDGRVVLQDILPVQDTPQESVSPYFDKSTLPICHLPMGMLKRNDNTDTWLWQVENNGSWRWDIGDYEDNIFLAASGPTGIDNEWRQTLAPGASFHSAPVAVCHMHGDWEHAVAAFTTYRRCIRRKHQDHKDLPIIFNDYMNCLMGDPNEEKILALLEPVAKCGAEYFVIDAGWYADETDWWNGVGAWEPSKKRFPMGFSNLLDKIRKKGLKPGLWIEPEVIGVESEIAKILPDDAFFQRDGQRILEKNRYHLDYRHPSVIERMDAVIDRLVDEYGAKYFKFDYNIEVTQGTDVNSSAGAGQLGHNRAYLEWVGRLLDRYPDLVIENCSSGGQRMDYAMLAVHQLQSTSDQQSPAKYAAISAAAPTAVTPEQSASWAYPQPDWDDELNALTVVNSLLGRVHLSGRLDLMSTKQLKLISDGMDVYKDIRGDIANSFPFWPLGLPAWHDDWLALGLALPADDKPGISRCYLAVWRRGGEEVCKDLPIRPFWGKETISAKLLYPSEFVAETEWDPYIGSLKIKVPSTLCARLFQLSPS